MSGVQSCASALALSLCQLHLLYPFHDEKNQKSITLSIVLVGTSTEKMTCLKVYIRQNPSIT